MRIFHFMVLLSFEKHHSKSITTIPKVIQLCDGLMASGQNPLTHCMSSILLVSKTIVFAFFFFTVCVYSISVLFHVKGIPALLPVVEHGFVSKSLGSSALIDTDELETQREVMVAMLLRLVEYHQVLYLFSLLLCFCTDSRTDYSNPKLKFLSFRS